MNFNDIFNSEKHISNLETVHLFKTHEISNIIMEWSDLSIWTHLQNILQEEKMHADNESKLVFNDDYCMVNMEKLWAVT